MTNCISTGKDILEALESRISSWFKMNKVASMVLRYKKLLKKIRNGESQGEMINNSLLKEAEIEIINLVQTRKFAAEIKSLTPTDSDEESRLKRNSKIFQLDLFLDEDGVFRVGGRLCKSYLSDGCKYPVLLPKEERVTLIIMQWCYSKCARGGRGLTLNELQSCGYWVISGNAAVNDLPLCTMPQVAWKICCAEDGRPRLLWSC